MHDKKISPKFLVFCVLLSKNNKPQKTSLFFKKKYFRFQQFYYFIQLLCLEDYNLYI